MSIRNTCIGARRDRQKRANSPRSPLFEVFYGLYMLCHSEFRYYKTPINIVFDICFEMFHFEKGSIRLVLQFTFRHTLSEPEKLW